LVRVSAPTCEIAMIVVSAFRAYSEYGILLTFSDWLLRDTFSLSSRTSMSLFGLRSPLVGRSFGKNIRYARRLLDPSGV
jgi:hypothetical protein